VLFSEPPRSQGDLNFSLFGFPVRVHPFFWLVAVLLCSRQLFKAPGLREALLVLLPWVSAVFLSILCHELGHAFVMRAYGFRPWITLHGFGGLASYDPSASYGSKGNSPLAQILISFAGPGAGFLLAAVVVGAIKLAGYKIVFALGGPLGIVFGMEEIGSAAFTDFLWDVLFISFIWGAVNLLPVYPLDGGRISHEVLLTISPRNGIRQSLILSIFTAAALAVVGLVRMQSVFVALMFGYLAFTSFQALQAYSDRRSW